MKRFYLTSKTDLTKPSDENDRLSSDVEITPNSFLIPLTLKTLLGLLILFTFFLSAPLNSRAQSTGITLEQGGNGPASAPDNPVIWQKGNLNPSKAHFIENYAVPYRVVMTNVPVGQSISVEIGYDTKHSGRHALDFLTFYQHQYPHTEVYGHSQEEVRPWDGYFTQANALANEDKFPIPAPSSAGSPVPGQPTDEFNDHISHSGGAHIQMTAYYGDITNIQYTQQQALNSGDQTESRIQVTFTSLNDTVVLAFGGHIASVKYWGRDPDGVPYSAAGINGSPYHVRLVSWSFGSPGNQEVQLAAAAVFVEPDCEFTPETESPVCINASMSFQVDNPNPDLDYEWAVINVSGANPSPLSGSGDSFALNSGSQSGSFTVELTASFTLQGATISQTCTYDVVVQQLSLQAVPTDVSCFGEEDGSIALTVTGGSGDYAFDWSNGASSEDLSGLSPGSYEVTVTDNVTGCSATLNGIVIEEPAEVIVSAEGTDASCYGEDDGFITVTENTGTSVELWKDGSKVEGAALADGKFLNLSPGSYVVKVSASGNQGESCEAETNAIVIEEPAEVIVSAEGTDASCYGEDDGFITVTENTGTSVELWKDGSKVEGAALADGKFLNLSPGSYVVKVSASGNQGESCEAETNAIVIGEPAELVCSVVQESPVICGFPLSGSATATVNGGTGEYTIEWSNGEIGQVASSLPAGLVTVTVTDENGCSSTCEVEISSLPCEEGFCFYTQGFYGNEGGTKCSENGPVTAADIMSSVLDALPDDKYEFGAGSRKFTLYLSDVTNGSVFAMLPGGGPSKGLKGNATYSQTATWTNVPISKKASSYGKIENNLLSQTITFFFNLGWNPGAAGLAVTGDHLVTIRSADCGSTPDITAQPDTFALPWDVFAYMESNGYGNTLQGLLNLANDVLGGVASVNPSSVTNALDAFNRGFDECAVLVEFYSEQLKVARTVWIGPEETSLQVYPNPFSDRVTFEFTPAVDGNATVELFNAQGTRIKTLFEQQVYNGSLYKIEYQPVDLPTGIIFWRFSLDGTVKNGKLMFSK